VNRRYLVAVALLAVLAVVFGAFGAVAPPLAEETAPKPQQEYSSSSSDSAAHFLNPPTYESDWVNITDKAGQYLTLKHGLNTTKVFVDITGKQSLDPMSGTPAWNKTYGGTNNEVANSMVQTSDGGYALAGYTYSSGAGGADFWLVKTYANGTTAWNKTYGGTSDDAAESLTQTSDGGYALAGHNGLMDMWLVKTDQNGNHQWNKTYGGPNTDWVTSIVQTDDDGYALAGNTGTYPSFDFLLVKTDSAGNHLWNKTYGGADYEHADFMVQTSDGGYAIVGDTGWMDMWLVKTDSSGNMQWNKTYGEGWDQGLSVVQTSDGGYALAGFTTAGMGGAEDMWLVKTDSSGSMQWSKTYGGTNTDIARSVVETGDGGYALAGYTYSSGAGGMDFWLVKTDSDGGLKWSRTYGGTSDDAAHSVVQTSDGGYAIVGRTSSYGAGGMDFWLVKVYDRMDTEHQRTGLVWTALTNSTVILYREEADVYWNYVRVRIWVIKEPSWIYGDINMDGVVDVKDLYILSRNYGKTFSLLSLSGIIAIAGIHTVKKRKQPKQPS